MNIIVIQANKHAGQQLNKLLSQSFGRVRTLDDAAPIHSLIASVHHPVVVLDSHIAADATLVDDCRQLRGELGDVPLIVVAPACRASWIAAVLKAGADDVISRPFDSMELIERVRALARRAHWRSQPPVATNRLVIDRHDRTIWLSGKRVNLTSLEFDLLCYLHDRPGSPVTVADITSDVHGTNHRDSNVVRQLIHKLRKKLDHEIKIITHRGKGYSLVLPVSDVPSK
jgi:DNA-binding response OmpR family regulator